jgi:hypothetical protein
MSLFGMITLCHVNEVTMLYILEERIDLLLEMFLHFSSDSDYKLVIWLYPESDCNNLIGYDVIKGRSEEYLPATTYQNSDYKFTRPIKVSPDIIERVKENISDLSRVVDSFCFYLNEPGWKFCSIGHEGMGLVNDDSMFDEIKAKGFIVSKSAPEWW